MSQNLRGRLERKSEEGEVEEQRNEKMRERLDGKKANMPPSSEFCLDSAIISSSPGRILDVSRNIHFSRASPNK